MLIFETIDRLNRMHQLIKREATGTPDEFAGRFNIRRRQLYNILDEFKGYGAEICYSRVKNSFYYENGFEVFVKISVDPLSDIDRLTIVAGCHGANNTFDTKARWTFFDND
jgi:Predicted transcriptional regulator